jgi:mannose/cellobiose epimerase-like protein (N-acyl-D-glucosamine 2-epimerase family)
MPNPAYIGDRAATAADFIRAAQRFMPDRADDERWFIKEHLTTYYETANDSLSPGDTLEVARALRRIKVPRKAHGKIQWEAFHLPQKDSDALVLRCLEDGVDEQAIRSALGLAASTIGRINAQRVAA